MTVFNRSEVPQFLSEFDGEQVKLVAGLRFRPSTPCAVVALRYYKDQNETGAREGILYDSEGKTLATTGKFFDDACVGPKWVQMALQKPFNVVPGEQYTAAIDSLSYYTLSEDYRFADKAGAVAPLGGYYGFKAGRMPTTGRGSDNFWVDGKRRHTGILWDERGVADVRWHVIDVGSGVSARHSGTYHQADAQADDQALACACHG
jgi:hypothetical protein